MTPLQFETQHAAAWDELAQALGQARSDPARTATLYRRCCEHLALARARGYPLHITARLDALAHRAHQHIYRRHARASWRSLQQVMLAFPRAVRGLAGPVALASAVFLLPALALGLWCYLDPGAILMLLDADEVRRFEAMYDADKPGGIGSLRQSGTDWQMFGFYIFNNIRVAFQCFASGLVAGLGSLFYLGFNGALGGAVGGFLQQRGHGTMFWSFVVTHSAFELTAIVLSGAAGLRLGQALLMPGRLRRSEALRTAATQVLPVIYGVIGMLVIAAGLEAFWSSAGWVQPSVKFGAGAACWAVVLLGLLLPGRDLSRRRD